MSTRIPIDLEYATIVGKAVYAFSYYEWTIIWIIEKLESGFVHDYSRGKDLTSGGVLKRLNKVVENTAGTETRVNNATFSKLIQDFERLIIKRNALIHAHPFTDEDGKQILNYQTNVTKSLPDMKWPFFEVEKFLKEVDIVACEAASILDRIR
jgi:hypothetical protein